LEFAITTNFNILFIFPFQKAALTEEIATNRRTKSTKAVGRKRVKEQSKYAHKLTVHLHIT